MGNLVRRRYLGPSYLAGRDPEGFRTWSFHGEFPGFFCKNHTAKQTTATMDETPVYGRCIEVCAGVKMRCAIFVMDVMHTANLKPTCTLRIESDFLMRHLLFRYH